MGIGRGWGVIKAFTVYIANGAIANGDIILKTFPVTISHIVHSEENDETFVLNIKY